MRNGWGVGGERVGSGWGEGGEWLGKWMRSGWGGG